MDESLSPSFGLWVRRRRKALDLTQAELGARAGCTAAAVRKIEADERRPSRQLAGLLADALAITGAEREAFLRAGRGLLDAPPAAPITPPPATPHDLPAPLTSLVDRTRDIPAVMSLLRRSDVRLLTLVGPPGIGKTRLAIQAAAELLCDFPGGMWFVDLSQLIDPDDVLSAIARHAGVHELANAPLLPRFRTAWHENRVLLVLDNFEQVVDAALQITALLRECRGLKVLVTSRLPLQVYGEHEYEVPPLSAPPADAAAGVLMDYEAVQLFVARVRQHQPAFRIDGDTAGPVIDICRRLDGLPLAIELAAASVRRMPLARLAANLREDGNWLQEFHSPARDLPPRQRTLANAIAWSYELLDQEARSCFRRLGVFAGSFALEAAAAVCAAPHEAVLGRLALLADHSLLVEEHGGRWRFLEMIREFAWSQLVDEERRQALERHAAYFQERLEQAGDAGAIEAEYDNHVSALRWLIETQQPTAALWMCARLSWFWETHGYLHEGLALIRASLALSGDVDGRIRFDALFQASILAWQRHDFATALGFANQAVALTRSPGLAQERPGVLNLLGRIHIERGDFAGAETALRDSIEAFGRHPDPDAGFPMTQLGEVMWAKGDLSAAQALFDEALALLPATDMGVARAMLHTDRAELALARGDAGPARQELALALPSARGHLRRLRFWLVTLAGLLLAEAGGGAANAAAALQCLAAEEGLGDKGAPLSPVYQPLIARRLTTVRALLPEPDRTVVWVMARRWTLAQALAQAERWLEG